MYLYKYEITDREIISSTLEVKKNKSNYSLLSNSNKRIPFTKLNKVNDTILYLEEASDEKALQLFTDNLLNQADVYTHVANSLKLMAKKIEKDGIKH